MDAAGPSNQDVSMGTNVREDDKRKVRDIFPIRHWARKDVFYYRRYMAMTRRTICTQVPGVAPRIRSGGFA